MNKSGVVLLALACVLFTSVKAMANPEFAGHWQGSGTYQSEAMLKAVDADLDIVLNETDSQLSINECWTYLDPVQGKRTTCYKSDFTLDDNSQIFVADHKVGDVFPGRISVFQGNSQVSELMTFDLNEKRDLLFRYSCSNMDGGMNLQFAELSEVK